MSGAGKCFDCQRGELALEGGLCRACRRDREQYGCDALGLPELVTCSWECQGLEALCNECGGYGVVPVPEPVTGPSVAPRAVEAVEAVLENCHPEQRAAARRLLESDDE